MGWRFRGLFAILAAVTATPPAAVLFDFDGTIADSIGAVLVATNDILRRFDFEPVDVPSLVRGMALPTPARLASHAGIEIAAIAEAMAAAFRTALLDRAELVTLVPGMDGVFDRLAARGVRLGIVSNNDVVLVERVLAHWGMAERFGAVLGEGSGYSLKPQTGTTRAALERLSVGVRHAAFVGDGESDAGVAAALGIHAIGVEILPAVREARGDAPSPFPRDARTIAELQAMVEMWLATLGSADHDTPATGGRTAGPREAQRAGAATRSDPFGFAPLTIPAGAFAVATPAPGSPAVPARIIHDGVERAVVRWRELDATSRRDAGGSRERYRSRHRFIVEIDTGEELEIYFERQASGARPRWWGRTLG